VSDVSYKSKGTHVRSPGRMCCKEITNKFLCKHNKLLPSIGHIIIIIIIIIIINCWHRSLLTMHWTDK
jgi:hypothetical protein